MKQENENRTDSVRPEEGRRILRRADLFLILGVLLVGGFLCLWFFFSSPRGNTVTVRVGDEIVARYPLDVDGSYSLNGGTNLLVIRDGRAHMERADCPDGLCIRQGEISREGERIVCLPNRVMVSIENEP